MSFSLQHTEGSTLPHLQYLVALAVCRAVQAVAGADLGLRLKWPNDLYAETHKIGGVLCQSSWDGTRFHVLVGFGLNVANPLPTTSLHALALQRHVEAARLSREAVLAAFFNAFEPMHAQLEAEGFAPFLADYTHLWLHSYALASPFSPHPASGQRVLLQEGEERWVRIEGLAPSGYLLARDEANGALFELHPDTTRLNFWDGFLSRKL